MGVYPKLPSTDALWMGTYWPVAAPDLEWQELETSGRLAHRTQAFLTCKGYGTTTPTEYVPGVISRYAVKLRPRFPGSPVVVSGNFKKDAHALQQWVSCDSWNQPLDMLLPQGLEFNTYWAQTAGPRVT